MGPHRLCKANRPLTSLATVPGNRERTPHSGDMNDGGDCLWERDPVLIRNGTGDRRRGGSRGRDQERDCPAEDGVEVNQVGRQTGKAGGIQTVGSTNVQGSPRGGV